MNHSQAKLGRRLPRELETGPSLAPLAHSWCGPRSLGRRRGQERCPLGSGVALAGLIPLVAVLAACGPRVQPAGPGPGPAGGETKPAPAPARAQPAVRPPVREVLIGEMCPRSADGRPAVKPLFMRGVGWSDAAEDVSTPIERRAAQQFSVLAWDGRRAGVFSVAGIADVGEETAAVGAYAGNSPCARPRDAGDAGYHPDCVTAQNHCGLAVALLERGGADEQPFEEDADPLSLPAAGACVAKGMLLVDIDGDGSEEAFTAEEFVNPVRAPAEEVLAVPRGSETCAPTFAIHHAVPPSDPKHWRGLDVAGVLDLDGDGRRELILIYQYATRRTWAIYSATSTAGRLDLVGEAEPWTSR